MATYKNISDDWYITLDGGSGTIFVDGNLDVTGNITYVSELAVNDAFIIAAANNNGAVANVGFLATKNANTGSYAGLKFDIDANAWQISTSVYANGTPIVPYANLASGGTGVPGGNVSEIQINNGIGGFTANASLSYDIANNKLTLSGHQVLSNIGAAPTNVANSVIIYNNAPGAGSTGLYVTGNTVPADEVISLTRARLFSIIF